MKIYTRDIIQSGIPENIKSFIRVESNPLPEPQIINIKAFWEACNIISKYVEITKVITVIIGTSKFIIDFNGGNLEYIQKPSAIHTTMFKSLIFLNFEKMPINPSQMLFENRVASILEEFVHALMNINNEDLAHRIVALIYEKVEYIDGKIIPTSNHSIQPTEKALG